MSVFVQVEEAKVEAMVRRGSEEARRGLLRGRGFGSLGRLGDRSPQASYWSPSHRAQEHQGQTPDSRRGGGGGGLSLEASKLAADKSSSNSEAAAP